MYDGTNRIFFFVSPTAYLCVRIFFTYIYNIIHYYDTNNCRGFGKMTIMSEENVCLFQYEKTFQFIVHSVHILPINLRRYTLFVLLNYLRTYWINYNHILHKNSMETAAYEYIPRGKKNAPLPTTISMYEYNTCFSFH